jgi:hypothetical protein
MSGGLPLVCAVAQHLTQQDCEQMQPGDRMRDEVDGGRYFRMPEVEAWIAARPRWDPANRSHLKWTHSASL